jgi:hypothetical protein
MTTQPLTTSTPALLDATRDVIDAARRIGLPGFAIAEVSRFEAEIMADAGLARTLSRLRRALGESPTEVALDAVREADLAARLGRERARGFYLVLALSQVASAEARHERQGIPRAISQATLEDIETWVRHFHRQTGRVGLTSEVLGWTQRYLRGDLYRIGALQFELRPWETPLRVLRHRRSRALRVSFRDDDGTRRAVDADTGALGDPVDDAFDAREWELVFDRGMPALDMHIPAGTRLGIVEFARAIRDAYAFYAEHAPGVTPAGAGGEAWLLDPQVRTLLPNNLGLHALQSVCVLHPGVCVTEEQTIQRLFGPDVCRADLPSLCGDGMTSLLRAVVTFLSDPQRQLRACGGLILREELEQICAQLQLELG